MRVAIVGKGPSIDNLSWIPADAIVALNHAIIPVREAYKPPAIVYTMQKDGCVPHVGFEFTGNTLPPGHDEGVGRLVAPVGDETLIVSAYESPNCYADWPRRIVLDAQPWYAMSITLATQFAIGELNADAIDFYCMDSYTRGDSRTWMPDGIVDLGESYLPGAEAANRLCAQAGINVRWVTP